MSGNAESVERVSSACSASHPTMAQLPSSSASTINKNYCLRQPRRPLPRELLNELLICLPRHRCRFSALLSTSSVVYNLLFRNKSFRRWRQQVAKKKAGLVRSAKEAKQANFANFYEYVINFMKEAVELGTELNNEEYHLLRDGYEMYCQARQASLDSLFGPSQLREKLENELRDRCTEMLGLLDKYLIPKAGDPIVKLFCLEEKCKYSARLAKFATGDERNGILENLHHTYQETFAFASALPPIYPMRLELVMHFTEFYQKCPHWPNSRARDLIEQAMNVVNTASHAIMELKQKLQTMLDEVDSADAAAGGDQQVQEGAGGEIEMAGGGNN